LNRHFRTSPRFHLKRSKCSKRWRLAFRYL
jgi:hypothetical protein